MTTITSVPVSPPPAALDYATPLPPQRPDEVRWEVPAAHLPDACATFAGQSGGRLVTMVALDDREQSGAFRLTYVFRSNGQWVTVEAAVAASSPAYPSVTPVLPAAHWYEREARDLLGLIPEGHPDPRRLVLHDNWPSGVYPLRKDFDASEPVAHEPGPAYRFPHLHGEGFVEIPVGPIHAGVIEPGHFRFAAVGELVVHLDARLFYTHRGMEKLAEGKRLEHGVAIAERLCGVCALSHAVAYCQAVETLAGTVVPPRAAWLRTLYLELERLYNHIGDLGNICAGTGFAVGASQGARLKDDLQRLNERLAGNRYLRGVSCVGGVRRDLNREAVHDARAILERVEAEFRRFVQLLEATESFQERLNGTGIVTQQAARDLGAVGVAARACGLTGDARLTFPHAAYAALDVSTVLEQSGDVRARVNVRVAETLISFRLAQDVLANLPSGALGVEVGVRELPPYQAAFGLTESPRGENVHWVRTGPDGTIDRYRVRSASYCNWPVVALAVPGNMVPDFPLINKSFELCYSCLDR